MQTWTGAVHPQSVLWLIALAGLALAVIGCALAVGGWRRERSLQRRLTRMQEFAARERERRAKRARLHVAIEQRIEISWNLTIRNDGPSTANGVTISINGVPLDSSPLVDLEKLKQAGTEAIAGNGQLRLPLLGRERPKDLLVEMTWSDSSGDMGFSKTTFAA
jgi:hypothetical protein